MPGGVLRSEIGMESAEIELGIEIESAEIELG